MRVDQFLKLKDIDTDDLLDVYCVLNDVSEDDKNILLTKSFDHISKLCAKVKIPDFDFKNTSKPLFVKIGRHYYKVPSSFDKLKYGAYLQISEIVSEIYEAKDGNISERTMDRIPEVVAIVFGCDIDKVYKANAKDIYSIGAFFLNSILSYSKLKSQLKEPILNKRQLMQECSSLTNTNTIIN